MQSESMEKRKKIKTKPNQTNTQRIKPQTTKSGSGKISIYVLDSAGQSL